VTFIDGNILKRRDQAANEFEDLILHLTGQQLSKLGTQKLEHEGRSERRKDEVAIWGSAHETTRCQHFDHLLNNHLCGVETLVKKDVVTRLHASLEGMLKSERIHDKT
jgi:hypothetical protein